MSAPLFFMAPGAPTPVAPFSHAVEVDGWCFITGQMPTWPDDDARPLPPDIEGQTTRVMENLKIVLAGLKLGLEHVICARVYITDFEANYPRMNAVYASYFPAGPPAGADLHRRHRPGARRHGRDRPFGQALTLRRCRCAGVTIRAAASSSCIIASSWKTWHASAAPSSPAASRPRAAWQR